MSEVYDTTAILRIWDHNIGNHSGPYAMFHIWLQEGAAGYPIQIRRTPQARLLPACAGCAADIAAIRRAEVGTGLGGDKEEEQE